MDVHYAQTPFGAGESETHVRLTKVQVGGDVVYGDFGPVTAGDNAAHVVGRSLGGDSVLGQVNAGEETKCRGLRFGNESPQALWVFSSDACGYGFAHVTISHAGRTAPVGVIILKSDRGDIKLRCGDGMLLRLDATGN
jgi:hypothetical protein